MPKIAVSEEVQVLRFFEEAPLEKAEMLFNIVRDKMRSRMGTSSGGSGSPKKKERRFLHPDPQPKDTETGTV